MTIGNVTLEMSESGRICKIIAENGRTIAELLVHGPLIKCAYNAHTGNDIIAGRANIFRGELHGLSGYEYLDIANEVIQEKSNT